MRSNGEEVEDFVAVHARQRDRDRGGGAVRPPQREQIEENLRSSTKPRVRDDAGLHAPRSVVREIDLSPSSRRLGEWFIRLILGLAALVSVVTTVGIVISLLLPAIEFFTEISLWDFFTGTIGRRSSSRRVRRPALIQATFLVTFWALLVACAAGLGTAIFLSEYASPRVRDILKPIIEILAAIPTVVYGYFALTAVTPLLLRSIGVQVEIFNVLAGGLVIGVMLIPTIASLSEDAMSAVPQALRDGAYGLGADRLQVSTRVVVPAAISGIIASFVLGDLAGGRRDDDRAHRCRAAAAAHIRPARPNRDADGLHRRDRERRSADWLDRVQDDLRGRPDAVRDHARDERHLDPARPASSGRCTNEPPKTKSRLFVGAMMLQALLLALVSFGTLGWLLVDDPRRRPSRR